MKALTPAKKYLWKIIIAPFLKVVECGTQLATPFLVRYIIDDGIGNGNMKTVWSLGALVFGLAVVAFGVTMVAQYLSARVSTDYGCDLKNELFAHMNKLTEGQLVRFGKRKILTIFGSDAGAIQTGMLMVMRLLIRPPVLVLGAMILSFSIDVNCGWIVLVSTIAAASVLAVILILAPKRYAHAQADLDEISLIGSDVLAGSRTIRAFRSEKREKVRFERANEHYRRDGVRIALLNAFNNPLTFFFINAGMVLVVYFGSKSMDVGNLTSGEVASIISYLTLVLSSMIMFSRMVVAVNRARASMHRVDAFLALEEHIDKPDAVKVDPSTKEIVRFDNVTFSYHGSGLPCLNGVSFKLKKGQSIGIIGGTGCGKSTVLSLIDRMYEKTGGELYLFGTKAEDLDTSDLHRHVAYVTQKPALFSGTIRDNLLIANKDATDEMLTEALKQSLAYEYVSKYPDYLDHKIDEYGQNLSGGQKQRLLLARVFLQNADLVLLDDSTSALDYISDKKVRANLDALQATKVFVSERVTTIMNYDWIIVMDNGRIIDQGKHADLLKRCEIYRDIYEIQVKQA